MRQTLLIFFVASLASGFFAAGAGAGAATEAIFHGTTADSPSCLLAGFHPVPCICWPLCDLIKLPPDWVEKLLALSVT